MIRKCLIISLILLTYACSSEQDGTHFQFAVSQQADLSVEINNIIRDQYYTAVEFTVFSNVNIADKDIAIAFWPHRFTPPNQLNDRFTQECTFSVNGIQKGENRFIRTCQQIYFEGEAYLVVDAIENSAQSGGIEESDEDNNLSAVFHWSGGLDTFFYVSISSADNSQILLEIFDDPNSTALVSNQDNPDQTIILTYLHIENDPLYLKISSNYRLDYSLRFNTEPFATVSQTIRNMELPDSAEGGLLVYPGTDVYEEISNRDLDWIKLSGF